MPVGNPMYFTQDFPPVRLPTQRMTYPDSYGTWDLAANILNKQFRTADSG
jgi:hypothetical protein